MTRFSKNRRGAKRKAGARYANGRLKPVSAKNDVLIAKKSEMCEDITKSSCPLDAALANGWISAADHRAALTYAALFRAANFGGPTAPTAMDLSTPSSALDFRGIDIRDMDPAEVAAAFDSAMSGGRWPRGGPGGDDQAVEALTKWLRVNSDMRKAARDEIRRVAIDESWPQWINQRVMRRGIERRAEAEKRELNDIEKGKISRSKAGPWEASRDLLMEACAHVRAALRPDRITAKPFEEPAIVSMPGPKVSDTTIYVDPTGAQVLEVVRVRRKGATA